MQLARPVLIEALRCIDDSQTHRFIEIGGRPANADDAADHSGAAQRQRAGSADETDADDREFVDAQGSGSFDERRQRPSAEASAARKRSFSSRRPTETRSHSGNP